VVPGSDATFNVTVSGNPPISYQWRFGSAAIAGATGSSYTRTNIQIGDAGNYTVKVTNSFGSVISSLALLTVLPGSTNVVAQWNFNSTTADTNTTTGTVEPSIGVGTAGYIGGTAPSSTGFATGSTFDTNTSDNSGWNSTMYPAAGAANLTAGVRFDVSTVGRQNIIIRWDQRVSNTGSKYSRLQYTTNGTDFWNYPTAITVATPTLFEPRTNSLSSLPGVSDNTNFGIRIVNEFESTATGSGASSYVAANGGSYASSGTVRFDMVTIFGELIVTNSSPPDAALLGAPLFTVGQFQMHVSGTTGANYTVQASTNLSGADWTSVVTNAAPFTYTDSSASNFPTRFFRVVWMP